jgi:Type IV secretion-system coupling protein DNA-binding domain/TraM recognition site of TraD and TraG
MTGARQGRFEGAAAWSGTMNGDDIDLFDGNGDPVAYLGTRETWGKRQSFGLTMANRRQHMYIIGASGTGKTTLLRNLILQDIEHGVGVGVIDPHGDLSRDLLDSIPSERTDHVVYFNPSDLGHPIGLNLLARVPPDRRHRIVSGVVGAMKSIWRDSWGPRMEYILSASVAALLACDNSSILGIPRMLVDARYRRWVVRQVTDPAVRAFWQREFEGYKPSFAQEAIAPIQNKVGQLLLSPPLRNVLSQVRRKIDPRFMMDTGRILIANLSKGLLGDDNANLLGSLLVASFELAALGRAEIPEGRRRNFHLYIDEFHNFTTDSFATILAEARKYRLSLTLSNQTLDQIQNSVRHAVFGNCGTLVSFRVGGSDAERLAIEYASEVPARWFSSLANYDALVRPLPSDVVREPIGVQTMRPLDIRSGRRDIVIRRSREKYASRRSIVERKIERWFGRIG